MKLKAFALASLLVASPVAAQDYCITAPGFGGALVGRNFTIPRRNHCAVWVGFSPGFSGEQAAGSGGCCVNVAGNHMQCTLHYSFDAVTETEDIEMDLPAQTGTDFQNGVEANQPYFQAPGIVGRPCTGEEVQ